MPRYEYQSKVDGKIYVFWQKITEDSYKNHPLTKEPIKRVVLSSPWVKEGVTRRSTIINKKLAAATPCKCTKNSCHHG